MNYPLSEKYSTPELMAKMMGPNPLKLEEEMLLGHKIPEKSVVCDLGSGQGVFPRDGSDGRGNRSGKGRCTRSAF